MKMTLLLILLTISIPAFSPEHRAIILSPGERICPFEKIWTAICKIESDFDPFAYNAKENSCGIVQIREVRIRDYNIRTGQDNALNACFSPEFSKSVFMFYCHLYGHHKTDQFIKSWNGRGKKAENYLLRVKKYL